MKEVSNIPPMKDFDWTGVKVKYANTLHFIPTYYIYLPHDVVKQLGEARNIAGACNALGAFIAGAFGSLGPAAVLPAAAFILLAAWMTAQLYLINWMDEGNGVTLQTFVMPTQPYWVPHTGDLIDN
ncbi:hypothetical protein LF934_20295 [Dickeya dadantii]|uniref:hypothetical protein n=1 Tax=Dickeya dadantii TaxID=204038 RepID=UPI001C0C3EBE|nr:hypothetical protein [Dickeya dadantii]MCA7014974.1 hypothetical protein [Dickeya dadantii]QWT40332.1 hypothetical protein KNV89_18665 [Dickeya dadantii]